MRVKRVASLPYPPSAWACVSGMRSRNNRVPSISMLLIQSSSTRDSGLGLESDSSPVFWWRGLGLATSVVGSRLQAAGRRACAADCDLPSSNVNTVSIPIPKIICMAHQVKLSNLIPITRYKNKQIFFHSSVSYDSDLATCGLGLGLGLASWWLNYNSVLITYSVIYVYNCEKHHFHLICNTTLLLNFANFREVMHTASIQFAASDRDFNYSSLYFYMNLYSPKHGRLLRELLTYVIM